MGDGSQKLTPWVSLSWVESLLPAFARADVGLRLVGDLVNLPSFGSSLSLVGFIYRLSLKDLPSVRGCFNLRK